MAFEQPNYTQIPNALIEAMPRLKPAAFLVAVQIARATIGYHKQRDRISLTQLETRTGLSRQGVINATKELLATDMIWRHEVRNGYEYELAVVNSVYQQVVNSVDTQKKERKERAVDTSVSTAPTDSVGDIAHAIADVCRLDYVTNEKRLCQVAAVLRKARYTVEDVHGFGVEWYRRSYPGGADTGKPPTPTSVQRYIAWARQQPATIARTPANQLGADAIALLTPPESSAHRMISETPQACALS